jgi:putative tricarboxylic transport membrane protein
VALASKQIAKGELVFTSFLFATSVVVLVDTTNMVESNAVGFVGPKVFAYIVGGLMFFLSALQLIFVLRGAKGEPEGIEAGTATDKPNWRSFGLVVLALALYAALIELLGFLVMGPVLYFLVGKAIGVKRNLLLGVVAVLVSIAVFIGFTQGLQLYLPLGFDFLIPTPAESVEDGGW